MGNFVYSLRENPYFIYIVWTCFVDGQSKINYFD